MACRQATAARALQANGFGIWSSGFEGFKISGFGLGLGLGISLLGLVGLEIASFCEVQGVQVLNESPCTLRPGVHSSIIGLQINVGT